MSEPVRLPAFVSLRDYFAGQALIGFLIGGWKPTEAPTPEWPKERIAADWAYRYADRMMQAREKKL